MSILIAIAFVDIVRNAVLRRAPLSFVRRQYRALTGAFMAIGLKYGATEAADQATKKKTYSIIMEMTERFRKRNNSVICRELMNCDINTPEGKKIAVERKLFSTVCPKMVKDATELLEEILNEN